MSRTDIVKELRLIREQHEPHRYKKLSSPPDKPPRLLGVNGTHFLLKILERSNDGLTDAIEAFASKRTLMLFLAARAHLETTGSIGY